MSGKPICGDCRFFSPWAGKPTDPNDVPSGDCRRRSPNTRMGRKDFSTGKTDPDEAVWPPVYADDFCGEWRAVGTEAAA